MTASTERGHEVWTELSARLTTYPCLQFSVENPPASAARSSDISGSYGMMRTVVQEGS